MRPGRKARYIDMKNLSPAELQELLVPLGVCAEAREWAAGKDLQKAWTECPRADWLMWLVDRMCVREGWPSHREVVLAACTCAETAVQRVHAERHPILNGIELLWGYLASIGAWTRSGAPLADIRTAMYEAENLSIMATIADTDDDATQAFGAAADAVAETARAALNSASGAAPVASQAAIRACAFASAEVNVIAAAYADDIDEPALADLHAAFAGIVRGSLKLTFTDDLEDD